MKIEAKFKWEKLNRRFSPYVKCKPCIKIFNLNLFSSFNYQYLQNPHPGTMNQQPNFSPSRVCSWTDSDSATEESGEENNSCIQGIQPPPQPFLRTRISHLIKATRQEMSAQRANEAKDCIIGLLVDMRRFSTQSIQSFIDREWETEGRATVMGREGDRYLIHINNEDDRRRALERTPWAFDGALFATVKWQPNTPLRETRIDTIELWLQIWGLPFEYQFPDMAQRLARSAGEIISVDWEYERPRNIRFMRVRVAINYNLPLAPGATLEMDNGATLWVEFRYEMVHKLCLSCGMIGHNHQFCQWGNADIERMVSQRMSEASDRYGYPIVQDPRNFLFSNRMRAFLNRAGRRHNRLDRGDRNRRRSEQIWEDRLMGVRQKTITNFEETVADEAGPSGTCMEEEHITRTLEIHASQTHAEMGQSQDSTSESNESQGSPHRQEEIQTQLESLMLMGPEEIGDSNRNTADLIDTNQPLNQEQQAQLTEEEKRADTEVIEFSELTENATATASLNDNDLAETYAALQNLQTEFDNSVRRLELLEERHSRGFQNLADLEDMQYSFEREHARFEHICEELVRQSEQLLEDMQNRHNNDPTIQSPENVPRWISTPEGGAVFTNAKLSSIPAGERPESSTAAERRARETGMISSEAICFELKLQMEEGSLSNVGESLSLFNIINTQLRDQEPTTTGISLGIGEEFNPRSPSFICSVNEEDLVSAFLNDTPSPRSCPKTASTRDMNLLSWNVRGLGQPLTVSYGRDMVLRNNVQICFLMETKASVTKASKLVKNWGFECWEGTSANGLSGGTLLLWKPEVNVEILSINKNLLSAYIICENKSFWLTCIYGSPQQRNRQRVWNELVQFKHSLPTDAEWIVMGDFNQVLKSTDKVSESSSTLTGAEALKECLDNCSLMEIPAQGAHFTWFNNREQGNRTWERLDRAFATPAWFRKFEEAVLTNFPVAISDHGPLLIQMEKRPPFRKRPYRFELMWVSHP
ncbi:Endonuclease/exonuclease/phosphatase [Corchorus olitorius]|uniref:Endonuclease/exonuclease/phosphatase n=1 Tax=Corchorus olitorius TaxID=93759 RepID=A0A1R3HX71_9ROSI|nr:Endonuclease/exonuclease/phosphatase [Corchorus olitorius]